MAMNILLTPEFNDRFYNLGVTMGMEEPALKWFIEMTMRSWHGTTSNRAAIVLKDEMSLDDYIRRHYREAIKATLDYCSKKESMDQKELEETQAAFERLCQTHLK